MRLLLLFAPLTLLAGCHALQVAPWERGQLAHPAMQPEADRLERALDEHTYFSKETGTGGRGAAGGGCGCN